MEGGYVSHTHKKYVGMYDVIFEKCHEVYLFHRFMCVFMFSCASLI